jgi:hypothetical protein
MKVMVSDLVINDCGEMIDFPAAIAEKKNCLFIAAREQQVDRALQNHVEVHGWWSLKEAGFLSPYGYLNSSAFRGFDVVIFAAPRRVYAPVRETYKKLIKAVEAL